MRSYFHGYYKPTPDEFKALWNSALFVADASVLLNLYRYSESSRDGVLEVFTELKDRLWVPHQVALEFHRNRDEVISEQVKKYKSVQETLEQTVRELESKRSHPHVSPGRLKSLCDVIEELKKGRDSTEALLNQDTVLERISELLTDAKVGKPYELAELQEIYKTAEERYTRETPPGFADERKGTDDKYGDYVVWRQILDRAAEVSLPVLFVTDDGKEDWWRLRNGRTLGPRPELVEEFVKKVGKPFYMYKPDSFMEWANKNLEVTVEAEVIQELSDYHKASPAVNSVGKDDRNSPVRQLVEAELLHQRLRSAQEHQSRLFATEALVKMRHDVLLQELSGTSSQDRMKEILGGLEVLTGIHKDIMEESGEVNAEIARVQQLLLTESANSAWLATSRKPFPKQALGGGAFSSGFSGGFDGGFGAPQDSGRGGGGPPAG